MGNVSSVTEGILNSIPQPGLFHLGGEVCSKCLNVNTGSQLLSAASEMAPPGALQTHRWIHLVTLETRTNWREQVTGQVLGALPVLPRALSALPAPWLTVR